MARCIMRYYYLNDRDTFWHLYNETLLVV